MSLRLFRRAWRVVVDTLDVSALDLEFKILATTKAQPNRCALTIWNLSPDHRAQLQKRNRPNPDSNHLVGIPVQIEAGYVDETSVLFSGDLRELASHRDGSDWKTVLAGDDGGRAIREARINQTFAKGTPVGTVLSACCQALGVGLGNSANFTQAAQIAGIGSTLPHAMTLSGSAWKELQRLCRSIGLTVSIQRGNLQMQEKGKPLALGAIRLDSETGLLDSPEAAIDASVSLGNPQQFAPGVAQKSAHPPKPKDTRILKLRSLLIPGLVPGRQIDLRSQAIQGTYVITEIEYVGQTWAGNWHADMVVRLAA